MKKITLIHKCRIIENSIVARDIYKMRLKSPDIALHSSPGQFIQCRVSKSLDPFLRRPFSISRVDKKRGIIDIIYKVIGRGTKIMTWYKKDDLADVIGPLGNSFILNGDFSDTVIVAGGIGCAPLFYLIDNLLEKGKKIKLIFGAKSAEQLIDFNEFNDFIDLSIFTDDGSSGKKGLVTDGITNDIINTSNFMYGYACGPNLMYKKIQYLFRESNSFYWQVSMESTMACGTGVCQGCAIKMKSSEYKLVCSQGPVFNLKDINFNG